MNAFNLPEPDVEEMVTQLRGVYDTGVNPLLTEWRNRYPSVDAPELANLKLDENASLDDYPSETYHALVASLTTPNPAMTWDSQVPQSPGMVNRLTESLRNATSKSMHRGYHTSEDKSEAWQKLLKASEDCVTDQVFAKRLRGPLEKTKRLTAMYIRRIRTSKMSQTQKDQALNYIEEFGNKPYKNDIGYFNRIKTLNELKVEAAWRNLSEKDLVIKSICDFPLIPQPSVILSLRTYPTRYVVSHVGERLDAFEEEVSSELESLQGEIEPEPEPWDMEVDTTLPDKERQEQLQLLIEDKQAESGMLDSLNDLVGDLCTAYRQEDGTSWLVLPQVSAAERNFYEKPIESSILNRNGKRGYDNEDAAEGESKRRLHIW